MKPIVIAGGCYFESCEAPHWRALYGSGGRAAHALIGLAPVTLHTYFPKAREPDLYPLVAAGIEVKLTENETALSFSYFHPLSDPALAPVRAEIRRHPALRAEGEAVLRFGMLDGDAVVGGRRVVYDPQSVGDFAPFGQNGSSAGSLALVLNAEELTAATRQDDLEAAARTLLQAGAELVIVKSGVHGAFVHILGRPPVHVPAYWSDTVFKIGTGDVFSAAFTHAWAYLGREPVEAAHAASKSVAHYAASRALPLPAAEAIPERRAVSARQDGVVNLIGSTARLADRWLFEEAAWRLGELGAHVRRWDEPPDRPPADGAFLVLADQIRPESLGKIADHTLAPRLVVLSETAMSVPAGVRQTADFTTALYWACWLS
ncbi:MAG TPA: PfkB family carbohydrate kinase [Sphingomicrobium sp.]